MFVRRCAWHRKYHGRVKLLGVSSWLGWGVTFSDGMCTDCAARARAEWRLPAVSPRAVPLRPIRSSWRPGVAFACVVLLAAGGVTAGVLLGPPEPRTALEQAGPASSVVASGESGEGIQAAGPLAGATSAPPSDQAVGPGAPSASQQVTAGAASPANQAQVAEAPGAPDLTVLARPAAPIRVRRAAAKRPATQSYRPLLVVVPVEVVSAPEPAIEAPRPPARVLVALLHADIQAP